jgi:hypothetical protein
MSSFGANKAVVATDLSAAAVLPTVTDETLTAAASAIGGGAPVIGAGAAGSAGAVAAGAALLSVDFLLLATDQGNAAQQGGDQGGL